MTTESIKRVVAICSGERGKLLGFTESSQRKHTITLSLAGRHSVSYFYCYLLWNLLKLFLWFSKFCFEIRLVIYFLWVMWIMVLKSLQKPSSLLLTYLTRTLRAPSEVTRVAGEFYYICIQEHIDKNIYWKWFPLGSDRGKNRKHAFKIRQWVPLHNI